MISKKNVSGFEKLIEDYIVGLDYSLISKLFVEDNTSFEKLTLNNMDVSDNVIRKKNIEAINLKDSFSTYGANRSIITPIKQGQYIWPSMRPNNRTDVRNINFSIWKPLCD